MHDCITGLLGRPMSAKGQRMMKSDKIRLRRPNVATNEGQK